MEKEVTHNLLLALIFGFILTFTPSVIVYYFFGFEIGIIFAICVSVGVVVAAIVGIENTIINKK